MAAVAVASIRAQTPPPARQGPAVLSRPVPLGLDNFAVRAQGWKAARLLSAVNP